MLSKEEEFEKYLKEILNDLSCANDYACLYRKLLDLSTEYKREFSQAGAFWSLVMNSLLESALLTLVRAYDRKPEGINLLSFIKFIRNNIELISIERFRKELMSISNPVNIMPMPTKYNNFNNFLEEVSNKIFTINNLEEEQLDLEDLKKEGSNLADLSENKLKDKLKEKLREDEKLLTDKNSLAAKFKYMRDKFIAHKERKKHFVIENTDNHSISWDEFDEFVSQGFTICNYYSRISHNPSSWSPDGLVGKENYQNVLNHLRIALLTLDFTNKYSSPYSQEDSQVTIENFIKEVYKENYKSSSNNFNFDESPQVNNPPKDL
jgi:hypothetical protein